MIQRTGHGDEAPLILAAAAFAGNESADARLLEQMRLALVGGNDIRSQKSEVRSQKSEVRSQKSEVRIGTSFAVSGR